MSRGQRALLFGGLLLWAGLAGAAGAKGLVAGIYPGAVVDKDAGDVTVRVYLSHDPLKQVAAWYAAKVGPMTVKGAGTVASGGNPGRTVGQTDANLDTRRLGHVVMDQSTVVRLLKDMTATKDIGVVCGALRREPAQRQTDEPSDAPAQAAGGGDAKAQAMMQQIQQMQARVDAANQKMMAQISPDDRKAAAMSTLFDGLRSEATAGLHGHTKQELFAVYAKYKHLETSWYPTVKTPQGPESYDRWLLERDRAKLKGQVQAGSASAQGGAADMQALSAKIQAAAAAGRMDEVQRLSAQLQQGMQGARGGSAQAGAAMSKDHWDFWLAFLKDLDAHAYRTRIWVNTQPGSWRY